MRRLLLITASLALASGCASHEDPEGSTPKPPVRAAEPEVPDADKPEDPPPVEEPAELEIRVALSSVQLHQDCPDPKPEPEAVDDEVAKPSSMMPAKPTSPAATPKPAKRRRSATPGFAPSRRACTQSTMQLSFTSEAEGVVTVAVKEARLLSAENKKVLGTLGTRGPTFWDDTDGYKAWDEALPKGALKASYKLGGPDWNAVEKSLDGVSSYGQMYVLEVDVDAS